MRIHIKIALLLIALLNGCQCPREEASMLGEEAPSQEVEEQAQAQESAEIADGVPAEIGDAPWQVSLFYSNGNPLESHFCGGSIVDSFWILTACHCIMNGKKALKPEDFKVYYNSTYLDGNGKIVEVDTIIRHPKYDSINFDFDLALVRIQQPIEFNDSTSMIVAIDPSIDPEHPTSSADTPMITGWGETGGKIKSHGELMKLQISIRNHKRCQKVNGEQEVTHNMFCGGTRSGGFRFCDGDSGGAITTNVNDSIYQFGLICKSLPCGDTGEYPVFTSLYSELGIWVQNTMTYHNDMKISNHSNK